MSETTNTQTRPEDNRIGTFKAKIVGARAGKSRGGHDEIVMTLERCDDPNTWYQVFHTLSSTVCADGPNKGTPYKDVIVAAWDIDLADVRGSLEGRYAMVNRFADKYTDDAGEIQEARKCRVLMIAA